MEVYQSRCSTVHHIHMSVYSSPSTGTNLRFNGKLSGNINGINFRALLLGVIAITKDGRVYVVIRNPPVGLAHSLKILTPFADAIGWMLSAKNAKGFPNGFSVIGSRFTRNAVISFDTGELCIYPGISHLT